MVSNIHMALRARRQLFCYWEYRPINDFLLDWLNQHRDYALYLIPLIAFAEACPGVGLVVSGVILLGVCTTMYTQEIATLWQMLPLAFIGACLSDHLGFYLGRWIGPSFHGTKLAQRRKGILDKAEKLFLDHGAFAIIFGRLMTAIRSLIPLLTGVSGMGRLHYSLVDIAACAMWTAGLGLLVVGLDNVIGSW
ncbi:MAG: membrane-associated protein [Candidatus Azotimanducaceae bacterium]|jgi:membrane-associated protein